jgi:uncharacterized protein YciI
MTSIDGIVECGCAGGLLGSGDMSATDPPAPAPAARQSYEPTSCVVVCRDGPRGAAGRAAQTAAHLAYVETVLGEIAVAGPLFDATGRVTVGSLYVLRTSSLARARELIEGDPFHQAGVFASVEYFPHLPAAGQYIGGKIW